MSKQYSCDLCKKVFAQKIDFTRHQNKKAPCITLTEMQQITQTKEVKKDTKINVLRIFKNIMDILRDNEALVGPNALLNWTPLLILKLIEPHFGDKINIDEYEYDFSHIEDSFVENHKKTLLKLVRFSNLVNENEENIPVNMRYLWDDILSQNHTTKNIFLKGKHMLIKNKSTYKKIIDKINSIPLNIDADVLGDAYEEIFKDVMVGKTFGQFFTQPLIKKMMVKLINPQLHADGKIDTCCDPTMGTGGFLITYLQCILEQAKNKGIFPDWDFIKTAGIYGKELDEDTYQLAVSNMLISSGHMFEGLDRGDSIREPIERKFDNILANPPFGIKGLKYDDFNSTIKNQYVPIKTDNAVSLFIQAIIYMLKINGKCAVVLPDGQDLFSKTNNTLVAIREYLMKTCDLKEIIYLPSGIFTYTSIKTCVFYFVKKREGTDVLETKIKLSKTQKETGREYNFSKTHQTSKVKFYDYNPYEEIKNLLVEVPIEKIAINSYSLNYAEYMKDESEEDHYEDGVIIKTLGEVCTFLPKSKRNAKYGNKGGLYPFFKSSIKVDSYVDEPDYEEESLIIGDGGEANINYGVKFSTSDHCYILQNKNKLLLNIKYVYYYLYHNLDMMKHLYIGIAIKNISKTNIESIKIPIPSLERQEEIVKYLDFIYEKANKTSNEKIAELKQLNEYCLNNQKLFGANMMKELGEVCQIKCGNHSTKKCNFIEGEYLIIGGGKQPIGSHNEYNCDENTILCASHGSAGYISVYPVKTFLTMAFAFIEDKKIINKLYLYYYLKSIEEYLISLGKGTAQPCISMDKLKIIQIPIPSLERQKEIVEYCEYNATLIKQLENEIANNKKQAQQFITSIVQSQVQLKEEHEIPLLNSEIINEVQEEIQMIENEDIIKPKAKTKPRIKKYAKKTLIIEDDEDAAAANV